MIKNLKRRLTILFLCSVMGIFTFVFCLFINENIQSDKKEEISFFERMTSYLIFQLENSSDIEHDMTIFGQNCGFTLLQKSTNNSFVPVTSTVDEKDIPMLVISFEQELQKEAGYYANETNSSQSGVFLFSPHGSPSYYGIQVKVITQNGENPELYVIKEASGPVTILKKHIVFYMTTWLTVLVIILLLGKYLIRKAVKPVEDTLQSQKEFIAAASHELKAPLAVMMASAECLRYDADLPPDAMGHTEIIDSECLRMSKLVQDLLLLSSIDAHTWTLNKSGIDIDTLIINIYEKYMPICRKKKIRFQLGTSDRLFPVLWADMDRIHQILSIFMDNAITYSHPDSEISFVTSVSKNTLAFSIIDHGTGIADKDKPFIYDRFFCADKSRTRKEHYGLGLSIAKELVEMHNGTIELSDTSGGGCTFTIFLPL